jgi:DNA-binding IclR family transcriptional regulator
MTNKQTRTVQSLKTSLKIIEVLEELDGARVTTLAERVDLAPSTVHGHLATLKQADFVKKNGDEYQLGWEFLRIGNRLLQKEVYQIAEQKVEQLVDETQGRAHFSVEEHGHGVYLITETGNQAVRTFSRPGKQFPLHATAAGKAILSHLPTVQVEEILETQGLPRQNENTITNEDELFEELTETRERGFSINDEEHLEGVRAVGSPVVRKNGQVVGSISVSGPAKRMSGTRFEEEIPDLLRGIANEMELALEYQQ